MEALMGALTSAPTALGSAFGLSPEMISGLGKQGNEAEAMMGQQMKAANPAAPQMPHATPPKVDMSQLLALLKGQQGGLGT